MEFRKANQNDKEVILNLYDDVRVGKYSTWDEYYPCMTNILEDLKNDTLFVLTDNDNIIGAISIVIPNELDDMASFIVMDDAYEIARVAIKSGMQGKGLSRLLITNIIEEIKKRNGKAIHLSVAVNNIPAYSLYKSFGFKSLGAFEMYDAEYYICELVL